MKTVFVGGSWYHQDTQIDMMDEVRKRGFDVLCDWTTVEYQALPKPTQWDMITEAIKNADVVFLSFANMEERTSSATFAHFYQATFIHKPVVVYDPAKRTRKYRSLTAFQPVHPSFNHLMGWPLYCHKNVQWVDDLKEAFDALSKFAPESSSAQE